jgi:hypothetical protein
MYVLYSAVKQKIEIAYQALQFFNSYEYAELVKKELKALTL